MANDPFASDLLDTPKKKESPLGLIIGLVVITVIALGAGWFLGGQLGGSSAPPEKPEAKAEESEKTEKKEEGEEEEQVAAGPIIKLEPIIVALPDDNNTFLRVELVLIAKPETDINNAETKLKLTNDISAFIRTLTLNQISGPSGYLHFREDLLDRARLTTEGAVKELLIMSLVAE